MRLTCYNTKIDKFLSDLTKKCLKYDVEFICSLKSFVRENKADTKSVGYFDGEGKKLACSFKTTQEQWLRTLVHESCHLDQWAEQCPIWTKDEVTELNWVEWVQHRTEYKPEDITKTLKIVKELEFDCEQRTIEKINHYNLPINVPNYIKGANAYVLYYDFILKHRIWKPKIYRNKKLLNLMPDILSNDLVLTPEIEKEME